MEDDEKAKLLPEFSKIESNVEKVEFVERNIQQQIDTFLSLPEASKKNDKAEQLRLQGNDYFKSNLLLKAMEMYNQSICFAEANSEALGIGYANRSMIYFLWKKYELCLDNIELATTNGCPQRLMDKLNKRKNDCESAAADESHMVDEDKYGILKPSLSFRPHSVVPFISDCLELRENSEFGRHIVTKVDLYAGQVVAIEESFCEFLLPPFKYQRCTKCLRENNFNLFPCKKCAFAMFCSERCAIEADQDFHRIECSIIQLLSVHFATETFIHKAIRMTLRAIHSFDDLDSLRSAICKAANSTVFDLNHRKDMPQSERYEAIHGLQTNQDKRTQSELYECAGFAAMLYKLLMKKTSLVDAIKTDADKKVLKELLFRHIQIFPTSSIRFDELSGLVPHRRTIDSSAYADGLFAFHGLLNHSCEPNCATVCFNRNSTLFIRRPIKAGEQLFISYGMDYATPFAERKQNFLDHFKFECQCKACESGDLYDEMGNVPNRDTPPMLTWIDFDFMADRKYIRNNLRRYVNYINRYDRHFPCRQLCAAEGCLLCSLHVLYTETSLNYSKN